MTDTRVMSRGGQHQCLQCFFLSTSLEIIPSFHSRATCVKCKIERLNNAEHCPCDQKQMDLRRREATRQRTGLELNAG